MQARSLDSLPRRVIGAIGVALIIAVGYFDFLTGPELSFSIFYLAPVAIGAWYLGNWTGYGFSALSALVWYTADLAAGPQYSSELIPLWNAGVRLGFFVLQALVLSRLRFILEREQRFARTDFLTGAHNKRSFLSQVDKEIARAKRSAHIFSIAYLDLDDFKQINDRLGHAAGDKLLQQVATALENAVRITDSVARIGGDEFAILLTEADPTQVEQAGVRIRVRLDELAMSLSKPVGFSLGMVTFLTAPESAEAALGMADQLMFDVKKSGKNRLLHLTWHSREGLNAPDIQTAPTGQEITEPGVLSHGAGTLGNNPTEI